MVRLGGRAQGSGKGWVSRLGGPGQRSGKRLVA